EDEAVVLGVAVGAGLVLGLLAGQPGAPRSRSARAVDGGPRDRNPFGQHPVAVVQGQRRTAALALRVVGEALDDRDGYGGVRAVLVVAHRADVAVAAGERRHAVVVGGDRALAGAQRIAFAGEHRVAEARRQVEQSGGVG